MADQLMPTGAGFHVSTGGAVVAQPPRTVASAAQYIAVLVVVRIATVYLLGESWGYWSTRQAPPH